MPLTYKQLTEILLVGAPNFSLEETDQQGNRHVYRGHDVTAFVQHQDKRQHEHKVFDQSGQLIYHRDVNGSLQVSAVAEQWHRDIQRKKVGAAAVKGGGLLADSFRTALRWWGSASRGYRR